MKKLLSVILCIILCISFCSCGNAKSYEAKDYMLDIDYKEDFRILQLSDTHISIKDNREERFEELDRIISTANPDLIIVTGDLFTFADKQVAKEYFAFLDSYDVPWTVTFGNHDEQCYFSVEWETNYLNEYGSNCVFKDIQDDDVFGNSNFAINLNKDGKAFYQIIVMDSNRYNFGEYIGYDYIKQDQVEWYESIVNATTKANGEVVPSIAFFHIPLPEFGIAFDSAETSIDATIEYGERREAECSPKVNSGLFDKMLELKSTTGVYVGHDHVNNYRVEYKGIALSYGLKANDKIYSDDDMLGGLVIVIGGDKAISYERLYFAKEGK